MLEEVLTGFFRFMALFSLIAVLILEQIRPLPYRQIVGRPLSSLAQFVERLFNAGEHQHGQIAWSLAVGGLVLLTGGVYFLLYAISPLLAWLSNVAILYLTMGFRQFSHYYTDIQFALRMDDLPHARKLLAEWREKPADGLTASEVARLAIEEVLKASHRHVFGVLVCFILLPGPCGAVLYRVAAFLDRAWGAASEHGNDSFGKFSRQAFAVIDWFPARVTAAGFAVVGNFEDAVGCWRSQAGVWSNSGSERGLACLLASGAGALGVRLGGQRSAPDGVIEHGEVGIGDEPNVDSMQGAVRLIWRTLLLALLLLLLLSFASLVGA